MKCSPMLLPGHWVPAPILDNRGGLLSLHCTTVSTEVQFTSLQCAYLHSALLYCTACCCTGQRKWKSWHKHCCLLQLNGPSTIYKVGRAAMDGRSTWRRSIKVRKTWSFSELYLSLLLGPAQIGVYSKNGCKPYLKCTSYGEASK